jgi:hypothetical protein
MFPHFLPWDRKRENPRKAMRLCWFSQGDPQAASSGSRLDF